MMFTLKRQLVFGNGKMRKNITHTENLVQTYIKSEKKSNTFGNWYLIGDGSGIFTVNDIIRMIANNLGVKFNPIKIPHLCCDIFNKLEAMLEQFGVLNPIIHTAGKFHISISTSNDRAKADFGYEPLVGIEQIMNEIKSLEL